MALGAPLIALVLILAGLVLVVWWFARRKAGEPRYWRRAVIAGIAFLLIFTWDEILGRAYFYCLCAAEGGVKVYKQVELPAEYWNEDATLIETEKPSSHYQHQKGSDLLVSVIQPKDLAKSYLVWVYTDAYSNNREIISKLFGISKNVWKVSDEESIIILGTYTYFNFPGGWLVRNISIVHTSGSSCRKPENFSRDFFTKIFYRSK